MKERKTIRIDFLLLAVPLVELMYLVFTRMPGEDTVGDSSLCCCVCVTSFEH